MASTQSDCSVSDRIDTAIVTNDVSSSSCYSSTSRPNHELPSNPLLSLVSSRTCLGPATPEALLHPLSTSCNDACDGASTKMVGLGISFTPDKPITATSTNSVDTKELCTTAKALEITVDDELTPLKNLHSCLPPHQGSTTTDETPGFPSTTSVGKQPSMPIVSPSLLEHGIDDKVTAVVKRYPSGVPGLGNTILGPRRSRPTVTPYTCAAPIQSQRKQSEMTVRASEKRKASSSPSSLTQAEKRTKAAKLWEEHKKQPYDPETAIEDHTEIDSVSPDTKKILESALSSSANSSPTALSSHNNITSAPNLLPSSTTLTVMTDSDNRHVSPHKISRLADLINEISKGLLPYTRLHLSCSVARPLQIVHQALSYPNVTVATLHELLFDAQELLKVLAVSQYSIYQGILAKRGSLQQAGMEGLVDDARTKFGQTQDTVKIIVRWIEECRGLETGT